MKRLHVVAAIILSDSRNEVLITKRPDHLHKGGFWEFPGGKVEERESEIDAIARELKEELDLSFTGSEFYQKIEYDYPEKKVSLSFWKIFDLISQPKALEGQKMQWVPIVDLTDYRFPEANESIVEALQI